MYERGPLAKLGGPPDAVAAAIEAAINAQHPRTRYRVTPSARVMITQRRLMTDKLWDRFVATQFPPTRKAPDPEGTEAAPVWRLAASLLSAPGGVGDARDEASKDLGQLLT